MVSYQKEVFMSALGLKVLILVVVDNGLVHGDIRHTAMSARQVLILVVVDNGLVPLYWVEDKSDIGKS